MEIFATAWHRRDEPRSQDPLGFSAMASSIAAFFGPSLTSSTSAARYFSVLCAGLEMRGPRQSPKDAVLRFERIWAFGSVAAEQSKGVLGTRSAGDQVKRMGARKLAPVVYPFFRERSQARQGVWGIYAASAERLGLHDVGVCTPRGCELAAPILELEESEALHLAAPVRGKTNFPVAGARTLGERFGVDVGLDHREAAGLSAGLRTYEQQHRLARLLSAWAPANDLDLVTRLADHHSKWTVDLQTVASAALALEEIYANGSRLIDGLSEAARLSTSWPTFLGHKVVDASATKVPGLAARAKRELAQLGPLGANVALDLDAFLGEVAALEGRDAAEVCESLLRRHALVQGAKQAAAWVERHKDRLEIGGPRGALLYDPFDLDERIDPHLFRLSALQSIARAIRRAGVKV